MSEEKFVGQVAFIPKDKSEKFHPKVSDMVTEAIITLKDQEGSSLQVIKKHIFAHHHVDLNRISPFIRKYLKSAVKNGSLVHTKGKGGNASFKLSNPVKEEVGQVKTFHPKVSHMVIEALTSLNDKGGSSLQAIKKHIFTHNNVDLRHISPFIRKYLKSAVKNRSLVQTKGKSANGSFKLSTSAREEIDKKSKRLEWESTTAVKDEISQYSRKHKKGYATVVKEEVEKKSEENKKSDPSQIGHRDFIPEYGFIRLF